MAHRLVYAWHFGIPDGMEINHKDGQKWNNRISNLEAVTPKQNTWHTINVLGKRNMNGSRNPNAKLTPPDVERIFELRAQGLPLWKIGERIGISKKQVMNIIKGEQWKNRGEDPEHPALLSLPRKIRIPC
ncbi:MAG: HNH endonuclease [Candidatus Latescibacterota bacterium]